jgi:hypothetical protein
MDALYFRVSSDRQTTENQFDDLLQIAEKDGSERDWNEIRNGLASCVYEEERPTSNGGSRIIYKIRPDVAEELSKQCVYVEQGRSGETWIRPAAAIRKNETGCGRAPV